MSLHSCLGPRFYFQIRRFAEFGNFPIPRRAAITLVLSGALSVSTWIMPSHLEASNVGRVSTLAFKCHSGNQKACSELAKIAVGDKDAAVRSAAVARLTDQPLLTKIAVEEKVAEVRCAAVANLSDRSLLTKIAAEDKDASVRSAAVAKLSQTVDLATLKSLVDGNPNAVFSKDNNGWMPLHWAAANGRKDVVQLLLANKAEVNAKDNEGHAPLHWAAEFGHREVAEMLLADGAEVNAKDRVGRTPLHTAVDKGHRDVAELLLANQADVNARDVLGWTPLYVAACCSNKDLVELLLANHADVDAKSMIGLTPIQVAQGSGHQDLAEMMRQRGAQPSRRQSVQTRLIRSDVNAWWGSWRDLGRTEPTPLSVGFAVGEGIEIRLAPSPVGSTGHVTGKIIRANPSSRIVLMEVDDGSTLVTQVGGAVLNRRATGSPLLKFRVAQQPDVDWAVLEPGARVAFDCRELSDEHIEITNLKM